MIHELLFQNPVFHQGLNVTVRNGDKWMRPNVGDKLSIKETGKDAVISEGVVIGKALLPIRLVPETLLQYEHDPSCRNLTGLLTEMKRVYPDFSEDSLVTVLLFNL
ncbi:MAG: hypothetical protein AAB646_00440 [Patescibacteria group bacterium]